jgi:hypothetical protein
LCTKWQKSYLHLIGSKFEARNPCLRRSGSAQAGETRNNLKCLNFKCHKQESFGILDFENSDLFRISTFEFGIFKLRTLFGSGYAGLGKRDYKRRMGYERLDYSQAH